MTGIKLDLILLTPQEMESTEYLEDAAELQDFLVSRSYPLVVEHALIHYAIKPLRSFGSVVESQGGNPVPFANPRYDYQTHLLEGSRSVLARDVRDTLSAERTLRRVLQEYTGLVLGNNTREDEHLIITYHKAEWRVNNAIGKMPILLNKKYRVTF